MSVAVKRVSSVFELQCVPQSAELAMMELSNDACAFDGRDALNESATSKIATKARKINDNNVS